MNDPRDHYERDPSERAVPSDEFGTAPAEQWLGELDAGGTADDGPDVDTIKLRTRVELLEQWFSRAADEFDERLPELGIERRVSAGLRRELGAAELQRSVGGARRAGGLQLLRWIVPTAVAASLGTALLLSSTLRAPSALPTQYVDAFLGAGDFEMRLSVPDLSLDGASAVGDIEEDLRSIEVAILDVSAVSVDDSIDEIEEELGTLDALRGEALFQFELGGETGA